MTEIASSPVWSSSDHSTVDLTYMHPKFGPIPFTASANDVEALGRDLFERAVSGEFGDIAIYEAPPLPVPPTISRRQCAAEMFARGLITGPEAVAMTQNGTPPAMVETMLVGLPEPAQTFARIDFAATNYERTNALLEMLMLSVPGTTSEDIDQFFRDAALRA